MSEKITKKINIKGGELYITENPECAYRVLKGSLLVYLMPVKDGSKGRRALVLEAPEGSRIPSFVYEDSILGAWRFGFVALDRAEFEEIQTDEPEEIRLSFAKEINLEITDPAEYEEALIERYNLLLVSEAGFIYSTRREMEKTYERSLSVIMDIFKTRDSRRETAGTNIATGNLLYDAAAYICAKRNIPMEWERAGLLEADFPFYQMRLDGKDLYGDMHREPLIKDSFTLSAIEHAKKRLASMDEAELEFEKKLIETSLRQPFVAYTWWEKRPEALRSEKTERVMPETEAEALLTEKRLLIETGRIVSDIESLMVTTPHGRHLWCGGNKSVLRTPGMPFIESGYAGIALFLSKYIQCAQNQGEEVSVNQAKRLLDICRKELSAYKKGWETESATSGRKYADMQYQGMERLQHAERVLDGDKGAEEELQELIFGSLSKTGNEDLSELQTDIVADGRAGAAGQRLLYYRRMRDTRSLADAKHLIACIIAGREECGTYLTRKPSFHNSEDPSFYFGESGIGYVMLMLWESCAL